MRRCTGDNILMRCGAEDLTNQVGEGMLEEKSIQEQGMQAAEFD